jgi:hypothetical protein
MALKVRLYSLADEFSAPEYVSPLSTAPDDTYATFRVFLENEGLIDFGFDFWIAEDQKRMLPRFKKFNPIGGEVFVICKSTSTHDLSKRRRLEDPAVVLDSVEVAVEPPSFPNVKDEDGEPLQSASSSRIVGKEVPPQE